MKTRNPSLARPRGQKLILPGSLPPVKNAFITEAETVNAGKKFSIRDIAEQVGEHTEKRFVQLRQKQGRDAHPGSKGVGVPPSEERLKEEAESFI